MGTILQATEFGIGPIEQTVRGLRAAVIAAVRMLDRVLLAIVVTAFVWQERARQRKQLAEMSDHLRADLGLSAGDVSREADKPFWTR